MDEVKLNNWTRSFRNETASLQIEFGSFFQGESLDRYYELQVDEDTQNLSLKILDNTLPNELKERLVKLFNETRPEDSV